MEIGSKLKGIVRRPLDAIGAEWNRLAPRERRLVSALGGALAVCTVLVVGFLVFGTIADLKEHNDGAREALAAIASHRDEYLEAKARMNAQEIRIGNEKPTLTADLEAAAKQVNIQIPETTPRQPVPAGKHHLEHSVDITLRQVDLLSLTKFLAQLETGRRFIIVTRLRVTRRFAEGDKLDASLTATAFERVKDTSVLKKKPGKEKT